MSAELTPQEIAVGQPLGAAPARPSPRHGPADPRRALEDAVRPALSRPPCLVSFSGGRDSSAVLAVAAHVARRDGLRQPVPWTARFPAVAEAEETAWQERVVAHLGLSDWVRRDAHEEFDLVGPVAGAVLRRHGVLYPPNVFFHAEAFAAAAGGSVLTGAGGDALLGGWRARRLGEVARGNRLPRARDAKLVSPAPLRRTVVTRRLRGDLRWLTAHAAQRAATALAAERVAEPRSWRARVFWEQRRRVRVLGDRAYALLARDAGVLACHPLVDPGFAGALGRAGGCRGLGDRTAIMRLLFADLLPDDVLARQTKAGFDAIFWNTASRSFAQRWTGRGLDDSLVDPDALRAEWAREPPRYRTALLLQQAWLAEEGER